MNLTQSTNMKILALICWIILFAPSIFAQLPTRTGRDYAVFFYVTDFQSGWAKLPETAGEATLLKTELQANFGFTCESVPNPTRQQILDKIKSYNDRLTTNDQVLFFFSMHGYYDPASDLGYIVAADGLLNDPYYGTWIDYNSLRPYFAKCKAKHILVALDACYSGSFGSRNKSGPDKPAYAEGADCATKVGATFGYSGRQYVCSGNKEAKTPARSLFAAKFLEGLRKGPDSDGLLYFDDLAYWLGKVKNPEPENGYFTGHQPAGDFVFVRKNACTAMPPPEAGPTAGPTDQDKALWRQAQTANTLEAYRKYLRDCSLCLYTQDAEAAISRPKPAVPTEVKKAVETRPDDGLLFVQGGTFTMGCTTEQGSDCGTDEKPAHQVTVSDFYIGKHEVTQALWRSVMGSDPPELNFKGCDQCPAERVSWEDVQDFLQKINVQNPGRQYRLPTEAEWEYAARGGQQNKGYTYSGSNTLDEVGWYSSNAGGKTHAVGGRKANELGLFDMSGNVLEWCGDWYGTYPAGAQTNPVGSTTGSYRVYRGGSWGGVPQNARVAYRFSYTPTNRGSYLGFRLARTF